MLESAQTARPRIATQRMARRRGHVTGKRPDLPQARAKEICSGNAAPRLQACPSVAARSRHVSSNGGLKSRRTSSMHLRHSMQPQWQKPYNDRTTTVQRPYNAGADTKLSTRLKSLQLQSQDVPLRQEMNEPEPQSFRGQGAPRIRYSLRGAPWPKPGTHGIGDRSKYINSWAVYRKTI
jgi:hypothetical protein